MNVCTLSSHLKVMVQSEDFLVCMLTGDPQTELTVYECFHEVI